RNPGLVIVDDLAHTNCPGSQNAFRWQDVEQLLENHISVLATLNVINLESLKDAVAEITGQVPKDTIPDRIFRDADEV
ncbi:sensor histidine kinase KdpD, partial [Acinetobacter baumannii]